MLAKIVCSDHRLMFFGCGALYVERAEQRSSAIGQFTSWIVPELGYIAISSFNAPTHVDVIIASMQDSG